MTGKCPRCEAVVRHALLESLPIQAEPQTRGTAGSYICPHCRTILGVGIDPAALKSDTVDAVKKLLQR